MIMLIEKKGHELVLREGGLSPNTLQSNGRLPASWFDPSFSDQLIKTSLPGFHTPLGSHNPVSRDVAIDYKSVLCNRTHLF